MDLFSSDTRNPKQKHGSCSEKSFSTKRRKKEHKKDKYINDNCDANINVQSENPCVIHGKKTHKKDKDLDEDCYAVNNMQLKHKKRKHKKDKDVVEDCYAVSNKQSENPSVVTDENDEDVIDREFNHDPNSVSSYLEIHNSVRNNRSSDTFSSDDCIDDPIDFEVSPLHKYEAVYPLSNRKKKNLLSQGVTIKSGKFTHAEDEIILNNIQNPEQKHGSCSEENFTTKRKKKDKYIEDNCNANINIQSENPYVIHGKTTHKMDRDSDEDCYAVNNMPLKHKKRKHKTDKDVVEDCYAVSNTQSENPSVTDEIDETVLNDEDGIDRELKRDYSIKRTHKMDKDLDEDCYVINNMQLKRKKRKHKTDKDVVEDYYAVSNKQSENPSVIDEIVFNDEDEIDEEFTSDSNSVSSYLEIHNSVRNNRSSDTFSSDDCIDDPIDFEVPPLHKYESVNPISNQKKEELLSQGVTIKLGKFTHAEDEIILNNIKEFVNEYRVSDPHKLLGIGKYTADRTLKKFLNAKHFYVKLGKNLKDRSLHSIYKRARLLMHPCRNSGKAGKETILKIKRLQTYAGKDWNKIGDRVGRSGENCLQTYRWHEDSIFKGRWTVHEEENLIKALRKITGYSDISCGKIENISWDEVAANMPTRNSSQCRWYWANHLAWKPNSLRMKWSKACYVRFIRSLSADYNVEPDSLIDWKKIHKQFEDFSPSPLNLQKRWLYLKAQIPGHKTMPYKDIIKELCEKYEV